MRNENFVKRMRKKLISWKVMCLLIIENSFNWDAISICVFSLENSKLEKTWQSWRPSEYYESNGNDDDSQSNILPLLCAKRQIPKCAESTVVTAGINEQACSSKLSNVYRPKRDSSGRDILRWAAAWKRQVIRSGHST